MRSDLALRAPVRSGAQSAERKNSETGARSAERNKKFALLFALLDYESWLTNYHSGNKKANQIKSILIDSYHSSHNMILTM